MDFLGVGCTKWRRIIFASRRRGWKSLMRLPQRRPRSSARAKARAAARARRRPLRHSSDHRPNRGRSRRRHRAPSTTYSPGRPDGCRRRNRQRRLRRPARVSSLNSAGSKRARITRLSGVPLRTVPSGPAGKTCSCGPPIARLSSLTTCPLLGPVKNTKRSPGCGGSLAASVFSGLIFGARRRRPEGRQRQQKAKNRTTSVAGSTPIVARLHVASPSFSGFLLRTHF